MLELYVELINDAIYADGARNEAHVEGRRGRGEEKFGVEAFEFLLADATGHCRCIVDKGSGSVDECFEELLGILRVVLAYGIVSVDVSLKKYMESAYSLDFPPTDALNLPRRRTRVALC